MAELTLEIGGKPYRVPAITLGQLRAWAKEKMMEHDKLASEAQDGYRSLELRGEIITRVLMETYNDLDEPKVLGALTLENVNDLWRKLLGLSGFSPGEATPAASQTGT